MPEYLSPGVYVEEIDAGPRPIAGVSTSTAGMAGVTVRGPSGGKPKLVTNFLEFQRTFGGFLPEPDPALRDKWAADPREGGRWWLFPLAVKGFFDNGGQRLYVKRVASKDATGATGALGNGLVSQIVRDAAAKSTTLELSHLAGFTGTEQEIKIFRGDDNQEIGPAKKIVGYDVATRRIELDSGLEQEVRRGRGDYVQVARDTTETLQFTASSPGAWGKAIQVRVEPMISASLPALADPSQGELFTTRLTAPADADSATVEIADAPGVGTAGWVQIGKGVFAYTAAAPADGKVTLTLTNPKHPAWAKDLRVQRVRSATPNEGLKTLRVGGANRLYAGAVVQLDTGGKLHVLRVQSILLDVVTVDVAVPKDVLETDRLHLIEAQVNTQFIDPAGNSVTETFGNLRLTGEGPSTLVNTLAARSQLVRAQVLPGLSDDPGEFPVAKTGLWLSLKDGGADSYETLDVDDFVGVDGGSGQRTGIVALEDIDEIAVCAVPGVWSGTVQSALITHCELLKDRFAILDPQDGLDIEGIQTFRQSFDTKYAALYYPWLVTRDPLSGSNVEVPPSGHMAGIYARTDVDRGVHKAPANVVIRGILPVDGLAQDVTKRHQDLLNPKGINALRFFPGLGQRVWGARTLSSDSSWKYINVRRLFLFVEESIDEGTQWVVFEPNDEALWALVRQTVTNFLTTVWRSGALAGTTADEAFFVACDRSTMTEDDLANGRLICVIGIAPVFPAEFVIFRIQQKTRETQLA
jgi:phage tail sheath protein FI